VALMQIVVYLYLAYTILRNVLPSLNLW
jgi:hypothetical protein